MAENSELIEIHKGLLKLDSMHTDYRTWFLDNAKLFTDINKETSEKYSDRSYLKQCYYNCYRIAKITKLRYFEGMTLSLIPLDHAFLVDKNNRVVDPTLAIKTDERERYGIEYFGIEIPIDILSVIRKTKESKVGVPTPFLYWQMVKESDQISNHFENKQNII